MEWQLNRELSLRVICSISATLTQNRPAISSAYILDVSADRQEFQCGFLINLSCSSGTALYVGYNSNLAEPDPALAIARILVASDVLTA